MPLSYYDKLSGEVRSLAYNPYSLLQTRSSAATLDSLRNDVLRKEQASTSSWKSWPGKIMDKIFIGDQDSSSSSSYDSRKTPLG